MQIHTDTHTCTHKYTWTHIHACIKPFLLVFEFHVPDKIDNLLVLTSLYLFMCFSFNFYFVSVSLEVLVTNSTNALFFLCHCCYCCCFWRHDIICPELMMRMALNFLSSSSVSSVGCMTNLWSARDQIQALVHAIEAFYQLSYNQAIFFLLWQKSVSLLFSAHSISTALLLLSSHEPALQWTIITSPVYSFVM